MRHNPRQLIVAQGKRNIKNYSVASKITMWFSWFKKKDKGTLSKESVSNTDNRQNGIVYDEIIKVDGIIKCYCSSLSNVCNNGDKILKKFNVDRESAEEILDGLKFIIQEFPAKFPIDKMYISLRNKHAITFHDTIQKTKLPPTCPNYGITYDFSVGAEGLGWSIFTCDFMGDFTPYKSSKNNFYVKDIYSIKNVYEFINTALNAMGYSSIPIPIEKRNLVKAKYTDVNKKSPKEECQIGRRYFYGKGEDVDWDRAFNHFKNSAEGGYGKGMYYYACCMLEGKGTAKDCQKGKIWLAKACKANIAIAYERMGYAYGFKGELEKDEEKSQEAFAEAFKLFEKDAETGDSEALFHLALCYNDGHGVERDINKCIDLLNSAIAAGDDEACYEMALLYAIGDGVAKSDEESFKWYQEAANMGNVEAFYNIGYCYESGIGVQKDLKKAFEWYMKGAQKKHAYSQYKVGMCFLNGIGTEKNTDNAFVFLNIAGKKGFKDAAMITKQMLMKDIMEDME